MKTAKRLLSLALAAGLTLTAAITANAGDKYSYDYPTVKGNKYLISKTEYEGTEKSIEVKYTTDENHRVVEQVMVDHSGEAPVAEEGCEQTYGANGKVEKIKRYDLDENQVKTYKYEVNYEYDANGNETKETWTKLADTPYVSAVNETQYDANGNITFTKHTSYDSQGKEQYHDSNSFTYDAQNRMTSMIYYNILDQEDEKTTYTYDAQGRISVEEEFDKGATVWKEEQRYVYTYSEDGTKATATIQEYQIDTYFTVGKDEYEYDANGNITSYINYDLEGQAYVAYYKNLVVYDEFGNVLTSTSYFWDEQKGDFVQEYEEVWEYGTYEVPTTSPKTADVAPIAVVLTSVIALGALVISKKVKA